MNVLVSSAGRRGAMVRLIRTAVRPYGGHVFAVDSGDWSAACRLADDWKLVSRCDEPGFADEILDYCSANGVQLVIPTIDTELPDAYGPICFQAFVDHQTIRIIELNARFGGGYPVAHQAGADFIELLVRDALGRHSTDLTNQWTDGVAMTRWDDAVFTDFNTDQRAAA